MGKGLIMTPYIIGLFINVSTVFGLPSGLLSSVCFIESRYNHSAVAHRDGHSDSYGMCQVKYETAKHLGFKGTRKDLMEPKNNIYYAGKYLKIQLERYNNIERALVGYNRGNSIGLKRSVYSDKVMKHWNLKNHVNHF